MLYINICLALIKHGRGCKCISHCSTLARFVLLALSSTFISHYSLLGSCYVCIYCSPYQEGQKEPCLAQRCHVRALGSYLSGQPDSSDIDILVSPSPAALEAASRLSPAASAQLAPLPLLTTLLEVLRERGLVAKDVGFQTASNSEESDSDSM